MVSGLGDGEESLRLRVSPSGRALPGRRVKRDEVRNEKGTYTTRSFMGSNKRPM